MSSLLIKNETLDSQPERFPPCLLPASSLAPTTTGDDASTRGPVDLVLEEQWGTFEPSLIDRRISLQTVLKAAWALTLRCFVPADILCFGYDEQTVDTNDNPMLYILRIDSEDVLYAFLQRLETAQISAVLAAPTGYDIRVVEGHLRRHLCNTAIYYYEEEHEFDRERGRRQSWLRVDPAVDLALKITKAAHGHVAARLEFGRSHTSNDMAEGILRTFQHIFSQIVTKPDGLRLLDVDVCSDHDRHIIHKLTWSISPAENECVHDLIVQQCRLRPDRIAVCSWDGDLTYGELDDLSLRLAHHLVRLGVRPETFVLSCFDKSTWAIVTRLAILRAGGAYISIHASNPPAYLSSVICRAKAHVLVCDARFAERFRPLVPTIVAVTPEWLRRLPAGNTAPACETVRSDNACVVLFTSGSTGQPKGIIQAHQSYATAIRNYARNLRLGPHTRFFQFDDYAFDISNLEFLVPLIIGGCCCVPGPLKTVQDLADSINYMQANITFLTPTVAVKLDPADVQCLELLCVGGEPLPKDLLSKWTGSTTKLVNQYGMGEVAICCAYNDRLHLGRGGSNIGRPASGAIWVVDASSPDKLMPVGAVGELLMEGAHLSRRYLDDASLRHRTEAVFLEKAPYWMAGMHPERCSARLYRSGDLGRWNHDGTIDYIGRKDTILKLDGCRVDAVEVEHQARKCLSPRDAIVVDLLGIIDGREDPVLTAFLYLDDHPASRATAPKGEPLLEDAAEDPFAAAMVANITRSIAQVLPAYMIPTVFLLTTWMPRTASNKTDRKKIHLVGQRYYLAEREKRTGCSSHAQKVKLLPM